MADLPAKIDAQAALASTTEPGLVTDRQRSELMLRIGQRAEFKVSVDVTSRGLQSIAVLVSSILLSTAVLVGTAIREGKRHR